MKESARHSGIDIIGDVSLNAHICLLYKTREELMEIMPLYFKAGLVHNEFCLWITAPGSSENELLETMKNYLPNLDIYVKKGQIEIIPSRAWFFQDGTRNLTNAPSLISEKLHHAHAMGHEGTRIAIDTGWLEKKDWKNFINFEEKFNALIRSSDMLALCAYPMVQYNPLDMIDIIRTHEYILIKESKKWKYRGSTEFQRMVKTLQEERDRAQQYLDIAGTIMVIIASDRAVQLINKKGCEVLGYSAEEIIGKDWFENFLPVRFRNDVSSVFEKILRGEYAEYAENPVLTRNGEERIISWHNTLLRDNKGSVIGTLSSGDDVTERKRAEEELRREHHFVTRLLETSPSAIIMVNNEGHIIFANAQTERLIGLTRDQISQRVYKAAEWHMTNIEGVPFPQEELPLSRIMLSQKPFHAMQFALELPDEKKMYLSLNGSPIFNETNQVEGAVFVIENITEQVNAQKKIARLNRVYSVLSRINEAILHTRTSRKLFNEVCQIAVKEGQFRMAWIGLARPESGNVEPVAWYGFEEGYLNSIQISTNPDDPESSGPTSSALREGQHIICNDIALEPGMMPWRNEALKRGYRSSAAFPIKANNLLGTLNLYSTECHFFNEEEILLLDELVADISFALETIHKEELRQITEEELRFKSLLLDNANDSIYVHTLEGKIIWANKATYLSRGYTKEEFLELTLYDVTDPENRATIKQKINPIIQNGESTFESAHITKDGTMFPVEVHARTLEVGPLTLILSIVRDIHERKEAETALEHAEAEKERLQSQLFQAQKMEAIGTLAGGIAHDFNNVITSIIGYCDLALMDIEEKNPLRDQLKQIGESAMRAAKLTHQLLLFSRKQPLRKASLNLNKTIADLLAMVKRLVGEDITIHTELESQLWTIMADSGNIEQVIMNLIVNAKDAMPEGGRISITTSNCMMNTETCCSMPESRPGNFICISVIDCGEGMNKEIIPRIFEPFFTTKSESKGTGLGLSVVYGIVKQHEGWINVESQQGQGSTFSIYLPAFLEKQEPLVRESISFKQLLGAGEIILVVEDDNEVRCLINKLLSENGYTVFHTANAREALEIFEMQQGNFHLMWYCLIKTVLI